MEGSHGAAATAHRGWLQQKKHSTSFAAPRERSKSVERRTAKRPSIHEENAFVSHAHAAPLRQLEISRIQFVQIKEVNQILQCFHASIFLEFIIRGGAEDPQLAAVQSREWSGPPARPSASWYVQQFEIINDHTAGGAVSVLKHRAFRRGDDLVLQWKGDGSFGEPFLLSNFPLDTQTFNVRFTVACAVEGLTPVEIVRPRTERPFTIADESFSGHNSWELSKEIWWSIFWHQFDPQEQRHFPCLEFCVTARRKPGFYLWNVVAPMLVFVLLTVCTWAVPVVLVGDRLAASLALVLTCSAYKFSVAAMVPAVHSVGADEPSEHDVPAGHVKHPAEDATPVALPNRPASHMVTAAALRGQ